MPLLILVLAGFFSLCLLIAVFMAIAYVVVKVVLAAVVIGAVVGVGRLIYRAVESRSEDRRIR